MLPAEEARALRVPGEADGECDAEARLRAQQAAVERPEPLLRDHGADDVAHALIVRVGLQPVVVAGRSGGLVGWWVGLYMGLGLTSKPAPACPCPFSTTQSQLV